VATQPIVGGLEEATRGFVDVRRRSVRSTLRSNPSLGVGAAIVVALLGMAVLGPLVWRIDPSSQNYDRLTGLTWAHPMGTDQFGRDEFARVIHGAQVSLEVSALAVLMALALGLSLGVTAAVSGGLVDGGVMRVVDILFAFPGLVLAILMAGLLGPNRTTTIVVIGVVFAPGFARVARGASLSIFASPFVEASRCLGASARRIVMRDIMPNIMAPMITITVLYISSAILVEAGLSFLGLGIQPPEPSWGGMISDSRAYMQLAWWLPTFPGLALVAAVIGFNFLGDGFRDLFDPRSADG
jgi:peptide/nickel transport system permease protein